MALASAVELCRQTTSTRCVMAGARRLSSICSTIRAPTAGGGSWRFSGSSSSSRGGRRRGSTATIFECDSSTYSCTASSTCGAMSWVSPVYQIASPLVTTAEANRPSKRIVLERLSKTFLAADRLDHAAIALADGHADAVALDQPPPLVGDRVGRLDRLQRGMDGAGEILQPGPEDLPVGEVPQLAALEEIAGPLAHFQQEAEIAALHGRPGVVPLQHLDHAHHFHFGPQGGQHEQEIGGVGRLVACTRARMRRRQYPFRRGHRLVEQAGVLGLGRLVVAEVGLLEVDLILQGQLAFLVDRPDGPANRRQRGNDPPQEFAVELAGRDVLPR